MSTTVGFSQASETMVDSCLESAEARQLRREARLHAASLARRRVVLLGMALTFGLLGPGLCFGVYWAVGESFFVFGDSALHSAAAVGLATLAIFMLRKTWSPRAAAAFAGVLLSSALQALIVGLVLLPLTLVFLAFGIGLLGFIPFGTAWTLFRASRAAREASSGLPRHTGFALEGCGFLLSTVLALAHPMAENIAYQVALERLDEGMPEAVQRAHEALAWVPWLSTRPLVDEAGSEEDEARFERLSQLYERRFGESIETELWAD